MTTTKRDELAEAHARKHVDYDYEERLDSFKAGYDAAVRELTPLSNVNCIGEWIKNSAEIDRDRWKAIAASMDEALANVNQCGKLECVTCKGHIFKARAEYARMRVPEVETYVPEDER